MSQPGFIQSTGSYGLYANITADTLIKSGPGNLQGIVVNSHTNGTIKFWDALTATGTVIFNTITFAAGPGFYPLFGAKFTVGCFADISATIDCTIIYN